MGQCAWREWDLYQPGPIILTTRTHWTVSYTHLDVYKRQTYGRHLVQLSVGDSVLFATDGLHELRNHEGVEFCCTQLEEVWAQCGQKSAVESAEFLFDRQAAFSGGGAPEDDITAVVLKVLG